MENREKILKLLLKTDGFISGEELGNRLGVSRSSVWKAISGLRKRGCEIESVTNRGYRLISQGSALSAAAVERELRRFSDKLDIEVKSSVSSTNILLKAAAEAGEKEGKVLIAEEQTAGKGRLGRKFISPMGTGVYISVLLRPKLSVQEALFITTAAAVAVSEAVKRICGAETEIKWVNDIFLNGKKICGILTEASADFENGCLNYAVCGVGINITEPEGGFPEDIKSIAGAIYNEEPPRKIRAKLCAAFLEIFMDYYRRLPEKSFMQKYRALSMLDGRKIRFIQGNVQSEGEVVGIDSEARLLVRLPEGKVVAYSSGDVQLLK